MIPSDELRQQSELAALQRSHVEIASQVSFTNEHMNRLEGSLHEICKLLKEVLKNKKVASESDNEELTHSSHNYKAAHFQHPQFHMDRKVKVDLPTFNGKAVEERMLKVCEHFEWYSVPYEMQVRMISFHLTSPAYSWYPWGVNNNIAYTWESFLDALLICFGQNQFYNHPKVALNELKQGGTMAEYQGLCEELTNQITVSSKEWVIFFFIAGLQDHLKCKLLLAKPTTFVHVVSLAKLHEQKQATIKPHHTKNLRRNLNPSSIPTNQSHTLNRTLSTKSLVATILINTSQLTSNTQKNNSPNPPFKLLLVVKIKLKREKGLCYYCEDYAIIMLQPLPISK
ncbi:uncharacterized protein DS421_13g422430 [Arachis hypogaea]|nr:uncharacterized protein DS421_13g422430 [Arachis hypogaea]